MEVKQAMAEVGASDIIYLGDSVYAGRDRLFGIWLMTWNGHIDDPRNEIYLEPETIKALDLWRKRHE